MSQKVERRDQHGGLDLESGLEALRQNSEFRGPVESRDGHDHANDHLAHLYESRDEQFAATIPFVRQGLKRGERCLYIADDNSKEEVVEAMRACGIDVDSALDSGALSILTETDTYRRTGEFDRDAMLEFWEDSLEQATDEDSYTGIRATAEMTWALDGDTSLDRLVEYEAILNSFYQDEAYTVLCQYNRERFPPEVLEDVIRTHPHLIHDSMVSYNAYYIPPEEFFGPKQPAREVDRMMETLRDRTRAKMTLQEREQFHRKLYEINASDQLDFDQKVERLLELGRERFNFDIGLLTQKEGEKLRIIKASGAPEDVIKEGVTTVEPSPAQYCNKTMTLDEPLAVTDAKVAGWENDELYQEYGLECYLGVKVTDETGTYGTLCFAEESPRERPFTAAECSFLESMGHWVNYELEREERKRYLREQNEITASPDRSFEEKLQALFDLGCERFGLELGAMARVDPETDGFEIEYTSDEHEHFEPGTELPLSETYCTAVTETKGPASVSDPLTDDYEDITVHKEFGLKAYLGTYVEVEGASTGRSSSSPQSHRTNRSQTMSARSTIYWVSG